MGSDMALTKKKIDAMTYDGRARDIRWDGPGGIPNFGVRMYASGKKSFVLQYRVPGRRLKVRLLVVGQVGVITLQQARAEAKRHLVGLHGGDDPLDDRPSVDTTVKQFGAIYVEDYSRGAKKTWYDDERRLDKHIVPALGSRLVGDVQRPDVSRLHQSISRSSPIEANRVLALVSHLFTKAEEWGYVPAGHPNPARGVQKNKERARDRWLREGEVRRLMEVVSEESDPYVQGAILLYLLTGLRKTELLAARWVDVDLDRRELRLPDTKSGRPHVVHLSPEAAQVFRMLPKQQGRPWVFPGRFDSHRKDIKGQWERVRKKAGLEDVRLHDLRRTVGSWLAQQGTPIQVIGKILNHSHPAVTAVYARLADKQSRQAMDVLGEKMGEVLALPALGDLRDGSNQ